MHEIVLGMTFKDRITGFRGVATGFVRYLTGCNQALLAPTVDATGAMRESAWFDVQRLEVDPDVPRIKLDTYTYPGPGSDKPAPKR